MGVKPASGKVCTKTVAEMASRSKIQAQDAVSRFQQGEKDSKICLTSGVRLHIGIGTVEQRARPIDRRLFRYVRKLTAAVKPRARITFQGLVGHLVAKRIQYSSADDVLRCNEFDLRALTRGFVRQGFCYQRI